MGYRCGLQREKFPDLNAFRVNIHSLEAIICINITELSPITKTFAKLHGATDLFLDKDLSPCQRKARLRELFKGRLTSGLGLALFLLESLNGVNRQPSNSPKINLHPSKTEIFTVNRQMNEPKLTVKFLRYP